MQLKFREGQNHTWHSPFASTRSQSSKTHAHLLGMRLCMRERKGKRHERVCVLLLEIHQASCSAQQGPHMWPCMCMCACVHAVLTRGTRQSASVHILDSRMNKVRVGCFFMQALTSNFQLGASEAPHPTAVRCDLRDNVWVCSYIRSCTHPFPN